MNDLPQGTTKILKQINKRKKKVLSQISREDIRLVYSFTDRLGSGAFGTVRIAHKTVNPMANFAVKSIPRN